MALREHQTPKQEAFTMAHVETGNATEAYRRSYEPQNWTDNALSVQASKMLRHPKIVLRLDQLQRAHAERHEITVDGITSELEEARKPASSRWRLEIRMLPSRLRWAKPSSTDYLLTGLSTVAKVESRSSQPLT